MKTVLAARAVIVPENVQVSIKSRTIHVKGPLGELTRDFKHIAMDMRICKGADIMDFLKDPQEERTYVKVDLWFANRKQLASCRTVCSHIENMFVGVTRGFIYKLRAVYSHFPINVTLSGNTVEIRNFLGEKRVRKVELFPGVKYTRSDAVKDQIELTGIDITAVSLTAAQIQQATNIRNKDLRKFLDGIYVAEKGANPEE